MSDLIRRQTIKNKLALDGGGEPPTLGRGYVHRRTYTVRFPDGGRTYRLVPHDETRSCLVRDKLSLGKLRVSAGGGHVTPAAWRSSSKVLPTEAALGYALAVGLGTGGKRSGGGGSSAADGILDILSAWP
ncbi:hypothetical protein [Streptomyces klenkii]